MEESLRVKKVNDLWHDGVASQEGDIRGILT
jgi:hypothetical protein